MQGARVSVVIPSRLQGPSIDPSGSWFVERALNCLREQTALKQGALLQAIVAVDAGMGQTAQGRLQQRAIIAESGTRSQAAALNAGLSMAGGDYIAFLEDDDLWSPDFLATALAHLQQFDFVSSTQLDMSVEGDVQRISDFPTPSGWIMPRRTFERVGFFDESFRWHLDSDWLGRLGDTGLRRAHLVEATAPLQQHWIEASRPQLAELMEHSNGQVTLCRHASPWPLIVRTVHPNSGMAQIQADPIKGAESQAECEALKKRFGHLPW
ncbi:glycosyltransferase family 2 protein [Ahniella affigens]|uniref:Glycosyltransferase family 2 protein n=1 Tax=Ahniella affigens TaxID=2021234 RepID=A0A2P1PTJ3_9GAMM|nr:glycosyltransferase family A protein [Ahniella affigens]AVP98142.1 glycosyltransferase family 2 protein [Ahniella affigens]